MDSQEKASHKLCANHEDDTHEPQHKPGMLRRGSVKSFSFYKNIDNNRCY